MFLKKDHKSHMCSQKVLLDTVMRQRLIIKQLQGKGQSKWVWAGQEEDKLDWANFDLLIDFLKSLK